VLWGFGSCSDTCTAPVNAAPGSYGRRAQACLLLPPPLLLLLLLQVMYVTQHERHLLKSAVEMAVLTCIQHPNIVRVYACLTDLVEEAGEGITGWEGCMLGCMCCMCLHAGSKYSSPFHSVERTMSMSKCIARCPLRLPAPVCHTWSPCGDACAAVLMHLVSLVMEGMWGCWCWKGLTHLDCRSRACAADRGKRIVASSVCRQALLLQPLVTHRCAF
jgi:hypothetical protein